MSPAAAKNSKSRTFDPDTFLATIGKGRRILAVPKKQTIYAQGDEAEAVFYIQKGRVRLTVVLSPADYSLGSPESRAIARAWADAKNPRNSEDRQRDDDALLLYSMAFELHGRTHPDWSTFSATSIAATGKELRDNICGPIVPLHEDPTYSRRTDASGEFQHCFDREPRAGDLLRWEHVRTMRPGNAGERAFAPN